MAEGNISEEEFSDEEEETSSDEEEEGFNVMPQSREDRTNMYIVLNGCSVGRVMTGSNLYFLWKLLLELWFSGQRNNKVYVVTPSLDKKRFKQICRYVYNSASVNLQDIYVRDYCFYEEIEGDYRRDTNRDESKDIYQKVTTVNNLCCSFIARIIGKRARIIVTSASFNADGFTNDNLETVAYHTMSEVAFTRKYLDRIH